MVDGDLARESWEWDNLLRPLLTVTLGIRGPVSYLGSRLELTLVVRVVDETALRTWKQDI